MPGLLLIDDDPGLIQTQVEHAIGPLGIGVAVACTGAEGLDRLVEKSPDVILLDVLLPDMPGLEVYQRIRRIDARIPVIFVTATTGAETAIEAMQRGAYDYLFKPLDARQLRQVVGQALDLARLMREPTGFAESLPADDRVDAIIGRCPAMREVYKAIGRVADQNVTVLITGESGTGKELAARAIYQHSGRSRATFHAINCAAIPESLLESELFGHEKGAFTGADRRRIGKFEQANGGTLFLDEVGEMSLGMQAKLLRVLQDRTFERLGGNETIQADVRIITATNRDLRAWSAEGKFRPDLYYRLSVFTLALPPLRDRGEDLVMLIHQYLRRYSRELGRDVRDIDPLALEQLKSYSWPGNIRELQSVLKQALLQATGSVLIPAFLPSSFASTEPTVSDPEKKEGFPFESYIHQRLQDGTSDLYTEVHRQLDRILLPLVFEFSGSNQRQTARLLGIARQTLRTKLSEAGLNLKRFLDDSATDKD